VDLSDGGCTLVPEGEKEGADEELQHVDVAQDLDPSPEGPKVNLVKDRLGDQRGGSEWEPIKILLEGD
jgi:hypothetical protein